MKLFNTLLSAVLFLVASAAFAEKVNINTADTDTIAAEISGIGQSRAQAIVDYRTQNGKFHSIEELAKVKGIGEKTIEKNRDNLTL